jgi:uncharacterized membrane protein YebE (DUF533 family)
MLFITTKEKNMDAIKILGSLLSSGALTKGSGGGNILGSLVGAALGGSQSQSTHGGGALGDILGSVLGGGSSSQSSGGGGLGDILGSVLGGGNSSSSGGGGLGDLLGSVLGGGKSSGGGGLDDLLKGGLGGLLGGAIAKHAQTVDPDAPTPMPDDYGMLPSDMEPHKANEQATLLIKAMINAAKSDGSFDKTEQQALLKKLGNVTRDEMEFIQNEFNKPVDVNGFANEVPRGMEHQIYALSLSAIDLDAQSEANYLGQLAQALRISPEEANQIHSQLGAPKIFS